MGLQIKKNDLVFVKTGKEKGKTGKVIKLFSAEKRAIVEGLNIVKRHTKPTHDDEAGGILDKEAPIHISNLMLFCPKCEKGVRVGAKFLEDGDKVRYCRKCGEEF